MKKGQAAMEFLMTYGWAILVVLAAIGALAYFGVLSPDRFMPSKCLVSGGFSCVEYKLDDTANEARIYLQNNLGVDADYVNVTAKNKAGNDCTVTGGDLENVNNGAKTTVITFTNCNLQNSSSFNGDITVTYKKSQETETHTASGSLTGKLE